MNHSFAWSGSKMKKIRPLITWIVVFAVAAGWLLYINNAPEISEYSCAVCGLEGNLKDTGSFSFPTSMVRLLEKPTVDLLKL
jgi:hypothetical protein